MKNKNRAQIVQTLLHRLFPHPTMSLKHMDTYTLLIAVLLSARCTDKKVNEVTPRLFTMASSPKVMATLEQDIIREIIKPCGLSHTKAKAIKSLSEILVKKYDGKVPHKLEALKTLPGVGHKTALVIMAQAFNQNTFPVDTHIHRCAKRWKLSSGISIKQTETDLKKLFPPSSWNKLHLQIIHYGRKFCPAQHHKLSKCPICLALEVYKDHESL